MKALRLSDHRRYATGAVMVVLLMTVSCGSTSHDVAGTAGPGAPTASLRPSAPTTTAVATTPDTHDTVVSLSPLTYPPPGGPCATVATSTPVYNVPPACQQVWLPLLSASVPGQNAMATSMPLQASLGAGVTVALGTTVATGFYRWQAFQAWLEANNVTSGMEALDAGNPDPVTAALRQTSGQYTSSQVSAVPDCTLPTSIRVTIPDASAAAYLRQKGAVNTTVVVLATYPVCPGVTITMPNGSTFKADQQTVAVTQITPGILSTVVPFGEVWLPESSVSCGNSPVLVGLCGA